MKKRKRIGRRGSIYIICWMGFLGCLWEVEKIVLGDSEQVSR